MKIPEVAQSITYKIIKFQGYNFCKNLKNTKNIRDRTTQIWDTIYYKRSLNPTDLHHYQDVLLEEFLSYLKNNFNFLFQMQPCMLLNSTNI